MDERTPLLTSAGPSGGHYDVEAAEAALAEEEATQVPVFSRNTLPLTLEVKNVTYTVLPSIDPFDPATLAQLPTLLKGRAPKTILKDVSLVLKSGQLLAVLGSSGSGKTSLLDVIAGRQDGGTVTGSIKLNGKTITHQIMKSVGGYVVQEDRLLAHLTVRETLMFVAQMKMSPKLTQAKKVERVDVVMSELGLRHVADTVIGGATLRGLSGGERRRVSIAAQLLLDPSILFLDEPTSGLDAFTAHHIVRTLQSLAQSNRAVITTIHSPRSDIFLLFDKVMLMSQGSCVYLGAGKEMTSYFSKLGYPCPAYTSPADFYLDLSTIDFRSADRELQSRSMVDSLVAAYESHITSAPVESAVDSKLASEGLLLDAMQQNWSDRVGFFTQFMLLTQRAFKNYLMDREALLNEAVSTLTLSAVLGGIFWELGYDQLSVTDRYGLFYILSTLFQFMITLQTIALLQGGRPAFYIEQQDGLYSLASFFWAHMVAELPFNILFSLTFSIPVFFMAGLDLTYVKFAIFNTDVFLSIYAARCVAYCVAAVIVRFQQASFAANFIFTMFVLPAGFIFNLDDVFVAVRWLGDISYIRYNFEALSVNEFPGLQFDCPHYGGNFTCQYKTGEDALQTLGLQESSIGINTTYIVVLIIAFRMIQYLALTFINQRPRD